MKSLIPIFCMTLVVANLQAQAPQVIGTSPTAQSLITSPGEEIIITFDQPIDETTVTPDTFLVYGKWSGPMDGIYSFSTGSTLVKFTPVRDFFYGEWIRVRLTSGIENMSGIPLTNGYGFNYWTKALPASLDLVFDGQIDMRLPGEGQITCYGAHAADFNNDEFSDLGVVVEDSDDIRVLFNDGSSGFDPFIIIELGQGQGPSTNDGADFNHDGLIDMAIGGTYSNDVNILMGNTGTIFETSITYETGEGVRGLAIADFNGDGWDDIATANRFASTISILMNDGTGAFQPAINIDTGLEGETSIASTDLNNDGYMDLVVATYTSNRIATLLNDGTGNFNLFDTSICGGNPWMLALGDVDGDGNVDIAVANSTSHNVGIIKTDGLGGLHFDAYYPADTFPVAIDLGDVDGDGDLDFISSNVLGSNYILMENDGSGTFVNPRTYASPQAAACAIIHDRNNDGAMDISMIDESDDVVLLYTNSINLGIDEQFKALDLILYPNPVDDILRIEGVNKDLNNKIVVFDLFSKVVFEKKGDITKLDMSNFDSGMYLLKIEIEGNSLAKMIVKQ